MAILITSPIEVHLMFQKGSNFSIEEVFLLAQAIDEAKGETSPAQSSWAQADSTGDLC